MKQLLSNSTTSHCSTALLGAELHCQQHDLIPWSFPNAIRGGSFPLINKQTEEDREDKDDVWLLNKVLKHCVVSIKHQPAFAPFIKTVQTSPFLIMNCTYSCCRHHLLHVLPPLMRVQTDLAWLPKTLVTRGPWHLSPLVLQNRTS